MQNDGIHVMTLRVYSPSESDHQKVLLLMSGSVHVLTVHVVGTI